MTENPAGAPGRIRLIALGDELLAGVGDARALGWLGRAVARQQSHGAPVELFLVALPRDTSASLAERWERDVAHRSDPEAVTEGRLAHRVVIGLGTGDIESGISVARSRLNLAKVLDGLERLRIPAFVVGPPPVRDRARTAAIRDLSSAFADVCERRRVTYIDTVEALADHDQWKTDLALTGGEVPAQTGYGLMAWLVLHGGFGRWLGTQA